MSPSLLQTAPAGGEGGGFTRQRPQRWKRCRERPKGEEARVTLNSGRGLRGRYYLRQVVKDMSLLSDIILK